MPISRHFRDCKALLVTSPTHVSGAIASVQTFTFTFTIRTEPTPGDVTGHVFLKLENLENTSSLHECRCDWISPRWAAVYNIAYTK